MSRTFKLDRDPHNCGILYLKKKVTINPGLTILTGCNGSGKTTLMDYYIKPQLDKEGIPNIKYNNLHDGGNNARQSALMSNRMDMLAILACSSEGEQIHINLGNVAGKIGRFIRSHNTASEVWFMFDAIDSGLSIDYIIDVKENLFNLIIETNPDKDVYIIVAANSYEMCRGEQCLDVRTGNYKKFKTYEAYRKFVLKSKELKEKRYEEMK